MKLISSEFDGHRVHRTFQHLGENGQKQVSVETTENVDPVFEKVKRVAQTTSAKSEMRLKASIPFTLIDEVSKTNAQIWGVSSREAFAELVSCKTVRAQKVMKMLTEGMDYRKLQTKNYA